MTPDDLLRRAHAERQAKDQAVLERIIGRHLGGPDTEAGNGETLPDPAEMLAAAVADNTYQEGNEHDN